MSSPRVNPQVLRDALRRLKREMPSEFQLVLDEIRGRRVTAERNARAKPLDAELVLKWVAIYELEDWINGAE